MAIYMQINDIEGNVSAANYKGWIELDDYQVSAKKNISNRPGALQDRVIGLPSISQLSAIKKTDQSSPLLFSNCCQNKSLGTVTICNNRTDDKMRHYLEIKLYDTMLSNYDLNCANKDGSNSDAIEELMFSYSKLEMQFIPRDSKNQPIGSITAGYDLTKAEIL